MNLALINPKVWLEIAIVAILGIAVWYGYNWIYDRGADTVQRKWDAVEKERSDQSAKIAANALQVTKDLQSSADKQREKSNAQIATLNKSLDSAIAGLSNRPSRPDPSGMSGSTGTSNGCYPSELYREDSSVVIKLAGEADKLRIALDSCQTRYNEVRDKVK